MSTKINFDDLFSFTNRWFIKKQLIDLCKKKGSKAGNKKEDLVAKVMDLYTPEELAEASKIIPVLDWREKLILSILLEGSKTKNEILERKLVKTILSHEITKVAFMIGQEDEASRYIAWRVGTLKKKHLLLSKRVGRRAVYSIPPWLFTYLKKNLPPLTEKEVMREIRGRALEVTRLFFKSPVADKFEMHKDVQIVRFSKKKPKNVFANEVVNSIRILAFSDWRVQIINQIFQFVQNIEPVDFIFYAGDDIGRFEEEGRNYFTELSDFAESKQVLVVIGNDDFYIQKRVLKAKGVHDLYNQSFVYKNFAFIGLESCTSGPALFRHEEKDFEEHLKNQVKEINEKRLVVLSHTPPYGISDRGIRFAELDKNTHHIGSTALRQFIETENIDLVICGHCHSHGGMTERLGRTTIVNVSSHDNPGAKGNFAIIELTKDGIVNVEWHNTSQIAGTDSLMQIYGIGPVRAEILMRGGVSGITQIVECEDLPELSRKTKFSENSLKLFQLRAKSIVNNKIYQIAPFNISYGKMIFFDIETDIACQRIWLIGVQTDGQFTQLYADDWEQERDILERFIDILRNHPDHALISFSGTNFDYRVTLNAMRRNGLDENFLTSHPHMDLSILLRRCFIFPNQCFALKDLGSFLGHPFKYPDLDGFTVALNYHKHIEEGDPLDPKMLEYNQDDVRVLPFIIKKVRGEFEVEKVYPFKKLIKEKG